MFLKKDKENSYVIFNHYKKMQCMWEGQGEGIHLNRLYEPKDYLEQEYLSL